MSTSPSNPTISKVLHALVFAWSLVMFFKAYPGLVHRAIWQHAKYKGDVLVEGTAAMYLGGAYALIGLALLAALSAEYGVEQRTSKLMAGVLLASALGMGALSILARH